MRRDFFSIILPAFVFSLLLQGCSSDLEDEKYDFLPGTFPKLVDVPARPVVPQNRPNSHYFENIQKKLLLEREEAYKDKQENLNQMKEADQAPLLAEDKE